MKRIVLYTVFAGLAIGSFFSGCKKDDPVYDLEASGYPKEPGVILLSKCATAGCHNTQSKEAAAGLSLASWDELFEGSRAGAVVVPYSTDNSTLCLFANTYEDLGITGTPAMPLNADPLTREEVKTLMNWVSAGAPNANGEVAFAENPFRKKYYVTNQGCDVVTVIDAATALQARYISVGNTPAVESPHYVRVTADGNYWCVVSLGGLKLQKYRTADDKLAGEAYIGPGYWNTIALSNDSRYAYCVDWQTTGKVVKVDLNTMTAVQTFQGGGELIQSHGSFVSPDNNTLYITCQSGNYITKVDVSVNGPGFEKVVLDGTGIPNANAALKIHEVAFTPDGSKYFVTCQGSGEVRAVDAVTDQVLAVIPVGADPVEMSFSEQLPYMFITCMDDTVTYPGKTGSVWIVNYQSNTAIGSVNTGYQPHGIAVNDDKREVLVANRNINPNGPAPHHTTSCGGRNGYVTFIDMNTLQLVPGKKLELAVDPYSAAYRK